MRAREPDADGHVDRGGVKLHFEVFGDGAPTLVLLPTWSILRSRFWKLQVPYLARHSRVVTFDGRGTGRSEAPEGAASYRPEEFAADTVAVMDATHTDRAVLVGLSLGAWWGTLVAAGQPDRVSGLVCLGPSVPLGLRSTERAASPYEQPWADPEPPPRGWATYNRDYWLGGGYDDFVAFFFGQMFSEPHSTKQVEDAVGWGREIDPRTVVDATDGVAQGDSGAFRAACAAVRAPVLVIHGDEDAISTHATGVALAELTGGHCVTIAGGGHGPQGRDPVLVNSLIKDFVDRVAPGPKRSTWCRPGRRPKRALYLSSPIGLGHARRDVAIARELRVHHPDLQIDWLAQHPVTTVLAAHSERVHPASAWLANESAHIESESGEHDLHAFQAIRRMDEILVNNFMVFRDVVDETPYDLVIGDEAWDVDYFLHENPELKRFSFAWMTDFVGWLPMPSGGRHEQLLTADYNAEMIEQRARFRRVRDRSIFVGEAEDVVPDTFGPGLPEIRAWTQENFDFCGYVTGFDPAALGSRDDVRERLGYRCDEKVCLVTVGGSGVGASLLRRVLAAEPLARRLVPGLRFVVVTGPRIDPASFPDQPGVEVRGFIPDLYEHLAACDLAVVQGGLTTCMELTATRRPFLYFPLANHFEQNFHVPHRLDRHGAGHRLDYAATGPEEIAAAIAAEIDRPVHYGAVPSDGAARAAALLAELV